MRAAQNVRIANPRGPPTFAPVILLCIFVLRLSSKSIYVPDKVSNYISEEDRCEKRSEAASICERLRNAFAVRKPFFLTDQGHANATGITGATIYPVNRRYPGSPTDNRCEKHHSHDNHETHKRALPEQ